MVQKALPSGTVSTHSRPKAAARVTQKVLISLTVFQHTAARRRLRQVDLNQKYPVKVSTHSRPKAAAWSAVLRFDNDSWFQHTAARRRLLGDVGCHIYP